MRRLLLITLPLMMAIPFISQTHADDRNTPKLIVQITVDQLRGDLPTRYYQRLAEGGFKYLWQEGLVYSDAHHAHANTETIVGHATLATGTYPSIHGMVGNLWFDRDTGRSIYNIEDAEYSLLSKNADVNDATEIDPTQRAANTGGRSPNAILTTTFSDELSANTNGKAKVFAVSVKDRGAVSMAGHSGKAFWFSKSSGEFVTSNYYYDHYPEWVNRWNAQQLPHKYADTDWTLLNNSSSYLFKDSDDRAWETDVAGFGRVFPHAYGKSSSAYFNTLLTLSPAGDELTLNFATTLLKSEKLGQGKVTDYLAISFSSTDYVGHIFGPSSLEAEDNILRLDRTLAKLFKMLDKQVGLDNILIVLSADHGGPDTPGYLAEHNIPAGYVNLSSWEKEPAIERIKKRFKIKGKLIEKFVHPYLYLSAEVNDNQSIDRLALDNAISAELSAFQGVHSAVSSSAISQGRLDENYVNRLVINNFHPLRSGDFYVVFKPNWFINDFDGLTVASTHGSPWRYDTYVPVVFVGAGIEANNIHRRIQTVDIAPTLSAYLGIKPPSGAVGEVLFEVFED
ncbi:MAG: alkaline phosphatase family protein [Oleispira sp.]|nr:alkaline phosphatase family protein [Oleispira sp.]MBL4880350.1 alkaline phosphatase family protein [Oleispira sp.]